MSFLYIVVKYLSNLGIYEIFLSLIICKSKEFYILKMFERDVQEILTKCCSGERCVQILLFSFIFCLLISVSWVHLPIHRYVEKY